MIFLKAKLKWFQWFGMAVVFLGLCVTGLPDLLYPEETVSDFPIYLHKYLERFFFGDIHDSPILIKFLIDLDMLFKTNRTERIDINAYSNSTND